MKLLATYKIIIFRYTMKRNKFHNKETIKKSYTKIIDLNNGLFLLNLKDNLFFANIST